MSYVISKGMAKVIKSSTGMSVDKIRKKSVSEIHKAIEKKIGHKLQIGKEPGHRGRGSMLIQMGRTLSRENVEKRFKKYFD